MSIEAELNLLAFVVADPQFKQKQQAFFVKYCNEFSAEEENKLSYTTIHKEYEKEVEDDISARLGPEAVQRLTMGLEAFIAQEHAEKSQEVIEAIDVLTSLADFTTFKATMLAKKAELQSGGSPGVMHGVKGIISIDECIDRVRSLRQAADTSDGWQEMANTDEMVAFAKQSEKGIFCRLTLTLPLAPGKVVDMFTNTSKESLSWRQGISDINVIKNFGPGDDVVEMGMGLNWALRYILSVPEKITCRCVVRHGWPEPGDSGYLCVPYNMEQNACLEEMGPMGIKTGVISPHPTDPDKAIVTTMDLAKISYLPSWGLSYIIRNYAPAQIHAMVSKYKCSESCKQIEASQAR